jgi:hypothetical protein
LVLLGFGSIKRVRLEEIASATASWEISKNLMKGHTYVFDVFSSYEWREDYAQGGYEDAQPVDVVIISPNGSETKLQAFFYAYIPSTDFGYREIPKIIRVEYGSTDSRSLDVDKSYRQVRFTVIKEGNYTARVIEETLYWAIGPPKEMVFEEEVVEDQNLFMNILQSSGLMCLFTGVVISVWMARADKKVGIERNKRVKKRSV